MMTDRAAFEALYAADPDPWRFSSSRYERAKYRVTLAALPARHFPSGLEVGCSIGVLTALLARRCRCLLALDIAEAPLVQARLRCRTLQNVRFARAAVPDQWPQGRFDLIVLSEILYFLTKAEIARLAVRVARGLRPGGLLMLVNWTGPTATALRGTQAASLLLRRLGCQMRSVKRHARRRYRLDLVRRVESR